MSLFSINTPNEYSVTTYTSCPQVKSPVTLITGIVDIDDSFIISLALIPVSSKTSLLTVSARVSSSSTPPEIACQNSVFFYRRYNTHTHFLHFFYTKILILV